MEPSLLDFSLPKPRLRLLLDHFAKIADPRQACKVMYPLREVLLLVVCGTICGGDDYDDIVEWGETHLEFLRRFGEFYYGIPCADWLRTLMNVIDPDLFAACFSAWVAECWPGRPDLVVLDGKTSRGSRNDAKDQRALHLVSAFATNTRLVLGQEAVDEKSNEIIAIPALLARLDLAGALVSIDAIGCNPRVADAIIAAKADYLLAVKDNQPTLHGEIESYFATAPATEIETFKTLDKEHGRLEMRTYKVSRKVDWIAAERSYPDAPRFPDLRTVAIVESRVEKKGKVAQETRSYISSRALSASAFGDAARGHWGIENRLHWVLDVDFGEDKSRLRTGHGAKNMAVVRHFALNLVRQADDRKSIKLRRKRASWDETYLLQTLQHRRC
jgi:predicted transposase YbfD/YdcC